MERGLENPRSLFSQQFQKLREDLEEQRVLTTSCKLFCNKVDTSLRIGR